MTEAQFELLLAAIASSTRNYRPFIIALKRLRGISYAVCTSFCASSPVRR
jgi:hypothetical protein